MRKQHKATESLPKLRNALARKHQLRSILIPWVQTLPTEPNTLPREPAGPQRCDFLDREDLFNRHLEQNLLCTRKPIAEINSLVYKRSSYDGSKHEKTKC